MNQHPWEPDGELIRCRVHKISFGKIESCPDCRPSPLLNAASVDASPPTGCASLEDHERWHMDRCLIWEQRADDVLRGKIDTDECDATTVAAKAEEQARKHRTVAAEYAKKRERETKILAMRRERERIRKGWGASN